MRKIFPLILISLLPFVFAESRPWDFLRPLSNIAYSFDYFTRFLVFIFSLALCIIAVKAYFKSKSRRFLLISTAFFLFAVEWILKVLDLFVSPGNFLGDASENVFELLILALLFFALFFKPENKK